MFFDFLNNFILAKKHFSLTGSPQKKFGGERFFFVFLDPWGGKGKKFVVFKTKFFFKKKNPQHFFKTLETFSSLKNFPFFWVFLFFKKKKGEV